jgi:hypothetical protein
MNGNILIPNCRELQPRSVISLNLPQIHRLDYHGEHKPEFKKPNTYFQSLIVLKWEHRSVKFQDYGCISPRNHIMLQYYLLPKEHSVSQLTTQDVLLSWW